MIKIKKEFQIPGTNIVLEEGDKVQIKETNDYLEFLKNYKKVSPDTLIETLKIKGLTYAITFEKSSFVFSKFDKNGLELSSSEPFDSIIETVNYLKKNINT